MTSPNDGPSAQSWSGRLSPADVHHVLFSRAGLGRRGYDEGEVDVFLERVEQELTHLIGERDDLRDRVSQLEGGGAGKRAGAASRQEEAQVEAVRLLAAAQRMAQVYVPEVAECSEHMMRDARKHSEQMVAEARRAAARMVEKAEALVGDTAVPRVDGNVVPVASTEQIEQQLLRLETLGKVVRIQLQTYLEALLRDVEEEWGRADPGAAPVAPSAVQSTPVVAAAPAPEGGQPHARDSQPEGQIAAVTEPESPGGGSDPQSRKRRTVKLHAR